MEEAGGSTKFGSLSFWPLNMLTFSGFSLESAGISSDKNFEGQGYGFGLILYLKCIHDRSVRRHKNNCKLNIF